MKLFKMSNKYSNRSIVFFVRFNCLIISSMAFIQCQTKSNTNTEQLNQVIDIDSKQKGAHVFGIMDSTDLKPLSQTNLDWITLVSWGFQDEIESPNVTHHDRDSINIKKHNEHWVKKIKQVRAKGFKVFFKPHLWVQSPSQGKWRSDIFPTNDDNWKTWQETYTNYILRYAKVAEQANAEMFCIGVEFTRLTTEKPEFWKKLIKKIRQIYSGKLTYAANWYNEYENITFWNELDYIGIQAYFPLTKNMYPDIEELSNGWLKYLPSMETVSKSFNKKVIFTEMGYRSTANSAIKPWEWPENSTKTSSPYSIETQARCYEAFFKMVWNKTWFNGVHLWQFRTDYTDSYLKNNTDFTPQSKPAEQIIKLGFK